jgi:hypothetical protein
MSKIAKVQDHSEFVRDMHSKAILSVDKASLLDHRNKKKLLKEMLNNTERINKLESDIGDIKSMLSDLLQQFKVQ